MSTMTPATAALKKAGISYKLYEYDADGQHHDFGHHAADELGRNPAEVCKTLLIHHEKSSVTTVVPVNCKLNLKRAAKIAGLKNAEMMEPAAAERATGYVVGGISPLGQKRRTQLTTVDASLKDMKEILVSGGKRGLSVGLAPDDLIKATGGVFGDIADPE